MAFAEIESYRSRIRAFWTRLVGGGNMCLSSKVIGGAPGRQLDCHRVVASPANALLCGSDAFMTVALTSGPQPWQSVTPKSMWCRWCVES